MSSISENRKEFSSSKMLAPQSCRGMFTTRTVVSAVFALCSGLATVQVGALETGDQVTFRLDVPKYAKYLETKTVEKLVDLGTGEPSEVYKLSQESEVTIHRNPTGFTILVKPRISKSGEPIESMALGLASVMRGLKLRYEFDAQGNLVRMHGTEKFAEELSALMPDGMQPMVDTLIPRVKEDLKDLWASRYQDLVGQSFKVGYRQTGEMPLSLMPNLPKVTAQIGRGIEGSGECAGKQCVVFFMGYAVDHADGYGESLTQMLAGWLEQMIRSAATPDSESIVQKLKSEMPRMKVKEMLFVTKRLVDPSTMMVHQEQRTKGFLAQLGDGTEMHWLELTKYTYKQIE